MSEPIDIKTKKTIPQIQTQKFDKSLVLENLEQNILTHWETWGKFQQTWTNRAYKTFKDLDKYIVMMYLVRNFWQNLSSKFHYLSMDEFYDLESITIEKINLIHIIHYNSLVMINFSMILLFCINKINYQKLYFYQAKRVWENLLSFFIY